MVAAPTPSQSLVASRELLALLREIEATPRPEHPGRVFTVWIADARAAEATLGGVWARRQVARIEEALRALVREALSAPDAPVATLLDWLGAAFAVLDTPALADLCTPLAARLLTLHPDFADRRHRRRFDQLCRRLAPLQPAAAPPPRAPAVAHPQDPRIDTLKAMLSGRRVLYASNRSAPEIEMLLAEHLGVRCEAIASAGNPRRRQALHARILRGSYDLVLVAHGFTGHADTERLGGACRRVGVPFCMVDKGRLARIVETLWIHRHHARLNASAIRPSAA